MATETDRDPQTVARGLTKAQKRLLLAMAIDRPKKWRAIYRHAKVRHWAQLPFRLAHPIGGGFEVLTELGREVRKHV